MIHIGGVNTTSCQEGGMLLQKYRVEMGGVSRYFSKVSGSGVVLIFLITGIQIILSIFSASRTCCYDGDMHQIPGFGAPEKANLPQTLGRHFPDLVHTFCAGCFLKSTVTAFSSFLTKEETLQIGDKLKGSLLKGSFDKCMHIDLPVPLPVPAPPSPPHSPPRPLISHFLQANQPKPAT